MNRRYDKAVATGGERAWQSPQVGSSLPRCRALLPTVHFVSANALERTRATDGAEYMWLECSLPGVLIDRLSVLVLWDCSVIWRASPHPVAYTVKNIVSLYPKIL